MSDRPLAAASRRLRKTPAFPRQPGRPRTRRENGTLSGPAAGHNTANAAQPLSETSENDPDFGARVCQAPWPARPNLPGASRMRAWRALDAGFDDELCMGSVCA